MSEGKTHTGSGDGNADEAFSNNLLDIFGPAVVGPVVIMLFSGSAPGGRLAAFALLHATSTLIFPAMLWLAARRQRSIYAPAERAWLMANGVLNASLPWIIAPSPRWSHFALGLIFAAITASDTLWIALRPYRMWKLVLALTTISYASFLALVGAWPVMAFCLVFGIHLTGGHDAVQELVHHLRRETNRSEALALADPLTGLCNRRGLDRFLIENSNKVHARMVVAALDIDDFKQINDRLGHHGGDAALIQLASHMQTRLGDDWLIVRSGGDEFTCVSMIGTFEDARNALGRIPSLLFEDTIMPLRVSVGLAAGVPDETLLSDASAALRLSKKRGKHRFTEVDDDLRHELHEARRLGAQLAEAVQRNDIEIWAQPIVHLHDPTKVHSYECLARWATPEGVPIPPSTFIPMIEDQRLTRELGETVIAKAADFLAALDNDVSVSVNVSASHFTAHGFVEFLHSVLARHALPPQRLTIEITETEEISLEDQRSYAVARQLREMGVGLAIDDFGTGYASFERLVRFPFSQLKLDRSIIDSATTSSIGIEHVLAGFGRLSQASGIEIVAEGVEEKSQLRLLSMAELPLAQGYLFGRPRPTRDILRDRVRPLTGQLLPSHSTGISDSEMSMVTDEI